MPWKVRKSGHRWAIVRSDTGEIVGYSSTKAKALASVRARYANSKEGRLKAKAKKRHRVG